MPNPEGQIPERLSGRYAVDGLVAAGSMASVYAARDGSLGRKVALKLPHPHLWKDPYARGRFLREARLVASLSHENIVHLYDMGEEDGRIFLAMEFVDGAAMDAVLAGVPGGLPALAAMELARQLLAGICEAHAQGIRHRDIKPSNLLLDRKGCLKVADFGLSRLAQSEAASATGDSGGTPRYASPELAAGEPLGEKSDLFSAGLVLVEAALGKPAVPGEDSQAALSFILREDMAVRSASALSESRPEIPGILRELCAELLRRDPKDRPSADDALRRLEAFALERKLRLGKDRLAGLPGNAEVERRKERPELILYWRAEAEREKAAGRAATARKCEMTAESLAGSANAAAPSPGGRTKSRRIFLPAAAALFLLAVFWALRRPEKFLDAPAGDAPESAMATRAPPLSPPVEIPPPEPAAPAAKRHPRAKPAIAAVPALPAETRAAPRASAFVRILSRPPHAEILVDGISMGFTPSMAMPLKTGIHTLRLQREGCKPHHENMVLKPGDTLEIRREMERVP